MSTNTSHITEKLLASFSVEADTRFAEMIESGVGIQWQDMRVYLKARANGNSAQPPLAQRWHRS